MTTSTEHVGEGENAGDDGDDASGEGHHPTGTGSRIRDWGAAPFALLWILNAVDEFDRTVLALSLDDIATEFGVNDLLAGLLPMAYIFVAGVVGVLAGNWADRWIRTRILSIGAVIFSVAGMASAFARTFGQFLATRALSGVGQGTLNPTHLSLLSDYYPVHLRGRVLGWHRAANPAGQILGAVIGGYLIATWDWRVAFFVTAVPALVFGLLALRLREPQRGEADLEAVSSENPLLREFLKEPDTKKGLRESIGTIWSIPTLRYLVFANATIGFALIGVVFWLAPFFERRYDFSTQQAAAVLGGLALGAFIGTMYGSPLADRLVAKGWEHTTRFGAVMLGVLTVGWTLAFLVPQPLVTATLLTVTALVASLALPGLVAVVAAASPPAIRSQSFSVFGLALSVCGAAFAPLLIGALSVLFQQWGADPGEALNLAFLVAIPVVMATGTWLIWRASRSATDDITRTLGDFLADVQRRADSAAAEQGPGQVSDGATTGDSGPAPD